MASDTPAPVRNTATTSLYNQKYVVVVVVLEKWENESGKKKKKKEGTLHKIGETLKTGSRI